MSLANSVAANAASAGLKAYVFIPSDLEQGKIVNSIVYGANVITIKGHYDEVNRLCAEIAGKFGWAFVNVNMRPYYAEGSKSMAYEIMEQSGWRIPQHTVVPMASGSLLTKIQKGYQDFTKLGLVNEAKYSIHGAQATGCSPISVAQKAGLDFFKPVKPNTIAKSLAIGTPADGFYALRVMKETGGAADDVTDDEIREGIRLLALERPVRLHRRRHRHGLCARAARTRPRRDPALVQRTCSAPHLDSATRPSPRSRPCRDTLTN